MDEVETITQIRTYHDEWKQFTTELSDMANAIASEYGLNIRIGEFKNNGGKLAASTIEVEVTMDRSGNEVDAGQELWDRGYYKHRLPSTHYRKVFRSGRTQYRIIGVLQRSRKYTVLCEDRHGQRMKFATAGVESAIETHGLHDDWF